MKRETIVTVAIIAIVLIGAVRWLSKPHPDLERADVINRACGQYSEPAARAQCYRDSNPTK